MIFATRKSTDMLSFLIQQPQVATSVYAWSAVCLKLALPIVIPGLEVYVR